MNQEIVSDIVSSARGRSSREAWRGIVSRSDCKMTSGGVYGSVAVFDEVAVKSWDEDAGYEAWLRFVLADDGQQSYSAHLPKIIWHSFELKLVILEKLQPRSYSGDIYSLESVRPLTGTWSAAYVAQREAELAAAAPWMLELYAKLQEICEDVEDVRIDAHADNWMMRQDGTTVVTDPLAPIDY